ncbi:MAG: 3(or 17)beta-hydroxysteroid dehydrogenase [Aliidongia sp.]|jgi:NAD(P)-dependent dehydrogenase (short-subunit alcohol dehydrogenase family)|nr:3(or 17)beta-hydroxysteroid dehydrogenase [Aliidongia sp.]
MTTNRLAGKCCFVTGAASGLGLAMAQAFSAEGAQVAMTDRDVAKGEAAAAGIANAFFLPLDVTEEAQWIATLDQAASRLGRLDVLVNNAGVAVGGTVETTSLEDFRWMTRINVDGVFLGCKYGIPHLRAAGGGSIINLSSVAGLVAAPPMTGYSATKGAVCLLTKSVAIDLARRGDKIRCNSIHPVFFNTPMLQGFALPGADGEKLRRGLMQSVPMGRFGEPDEVASLAVFLASDESKFITGAEMVIDGGFTAA